MSSMKELLIDGFILRIKHQLSETELNYDEFKNLIESIYKFIDKFPELKGTIKEGFNSNISKYNNQQIECIYLKIERDIKFLQDELNNILEYEVPVRTLSRVPSEVKVLPFKVVKRQKDYCDLKENEKEKYDEIFNRIFKLKDFFIKIHNLKC